MELLGNKKILNHYFL